MAQRYQESFEIRPAARKAVPQIMAVSGVQFSGKTFGALMLAAGLVKPGGKIGFLDTENKRGAMYADDPDVMRAIPQGYHIIDLDPPFHPKRYIAALRTFEEAGFDLVITDSGSHAWAGEGGGLDMKEDTKSWIQPKLWNKRFLAALLYSSMHHIVCLRAVEKTKIVTVSGKQNYVPIGIQPICEKTFPFDLGLAFRVAGEKDGEAATHFATPIKWPKAMNGLFGQWEPQLLTPEVGQRIREWNESAPSENPVERLQRRAEIAARDGVAAYKEFYDGIPAGQKKALQKSTHEANKRLAAEADKESTTHPTREGAVDDATPGKADEPRPDAPEAAPLDEKTMRLWDQQAEGTKNKAGYGPD